MSTDHDAARRDLIGFLQTIARPDVDLARLPDDADLLQRGVLDSLAIVLIIQYLEEAHRVNLSEARLDPARLTSVEGILGVIAAAQP